MKILVGRNSYSKNVEIKLAGDMISRTRIPIEDIVDFKVVLSSKDLTISIVNRDS